MRKCPDTRSLPFHGFLFVLALLLLQLPSCNRQNLIESAPLPESLPTAFKIVCWNVLYGFNHGKAIDSGAKWLANQQPDVVALQELNGFTKDSLNQLARGSGADGWGHPYSVILKEEGFPVGLTSSEPIETIKRQIDGFHHGYLHCRTHGVHFFVVHFWPGKDHEGMQVSQEIDSLVSQGKHVVLLGDFNTHSARDSEFLSQRAKVKPQYNVVETFENIGMVDMVAKHSPDAKFTCPSPVTIPRWSANEEELLSKRQRIDFILASRDFAQNSMDGVVITSNEIESISDHYPVISRFRRSN